MTMTEAVRAGDGDHRTSPVPVEGPAELLVVPIATDATVADVARHLAGDRSLVVLDGSWVGSGAVVTSEPVTSVVGTGDPFALLDRTPQVVDTVDPGPLDAGAVGGGWLGYLGYELGRLTEDLPPPPPRSAVPLPTHVLGFYDHVLRFDAGDGGWRFEALVTPGRREAITARLALLRERLAGPAPLPGHHALGPFVPTPGRTAHEAAVARAVELVHAGDLFQANIAMRLDADLHGSALELFLAGSRALRPAHAAFVTGSWGSVASLSPELFLRTDGHRVHTSPIKGTAPRHRDPEADAAARRALATSAKDRSENVMIVDLMRNDIGRVAVPGTVRVDELCAVRPLAGVWHLVSDVSGELAPGIGAGEVVRAAFPPGSITGAPKVRAMEVIAELEACARELYTGSVVLASPVAGLVASVAIRTFEVVGGRVGLGVGGGIVADSDPAREHEECLTKAGPLLAAVGGELALAPGGRPRPRRSAGRRRARLGGRPGPELPRPVAPAPAVVDVGAGGTPRIVVIDNYDSFTYNLVQALCARGAHALIVRNDALSVDEVEALRPDGVVISPGPRGPDGTGVAGPLVRALGNRVPILGVCLGHQVIAATFGATVDRAPRPVHGRTSPVHHDGTGLYAGLPSPLAATRYHSLVVRPETLPPELEVSAWTDDGLVMGVRHRHRPVDGVQFHPEAVLTAHGDDLLAAFLARADVARSDPWPADPPLTSA